MEIATNPNKANTFPNRLTLHIYKSILLFIIELRIHLFPIRARGDSIYLF